jgi:hypothetical protein
MAGKTGYFPVFERKGFRQRILHSLQQGNPHGVIIGAHIFKLMTAVAERNRVTVKSQRCIIDLGIFFEVTFGTMFAGPVGIDYFLPRFTGQGCACHPAAEKHYGGPENIELS